MTNFYPWKLLENILCFYSGINLLRLYDILGVREDCDDETLRLAFVYLAKRFHPDSGTSEASDNKFSEIERAYREIQKIRFKEREMQHIENDVEEFDIKHTAPQHRHYLSYNVGIGTPSKRQKQYMIEKAQKAVDNILEHRMKKIQAAECNTLVGIDKKHAKDIKTRYGMDRLVEDLIQEAMNKGEFNDLPGKGKPLKNNSSSQNPYVDFVTHKLNQVLIDNGFTPEWIQLSKEIRDSTQEIKNNLSNMRNNFNPEPLNSEEQSKWAVIVESYRFLENQINKKIDKYNLLVPLLQKQMIHINLEVIAREILSKSPEKTLIKNTINYKNCTKQYQSKNYTLFDFINMFFKK
ncbi:dnaJ homolog subfamily C member 28 isoform X2 [Prorops nasuta]|uniref:dnaJ homolog subfamily C member 28 isoform X2 n=1 Tax=Prorops nasuta TaxID=863751 RepID=UPI0034CE396F